MEGSKVKITFMVGSVIESEESKEKALRNHFSILKKTKGNIIAVVSHSLRLSEVALL